MLKLRQRLVTSAVQELVHVCVRVFVRRLCLPQAQGAHFPAVADSVEQATVAGGAGVAARHVRGAALH